MSGSCHLLDSAFSLLIQASLGMTALLTLVCKRYLEKPQRPIRIFMYDASKQAIGALYAHLLNIALAMSISHLIHQTHVDECLWYFVNFCVDLLLGIPLNYILLLLSNWVAKKKRWNHLQSGEYTPYSNFCNKSYLLQMLVWMGVITITKVLLFYGFIYPLSDQLESVGKQILSPVSKNPKTELVVVMVLVPFSFNIIQFWVQDTFLKGKQNHRSLHHQNPLLREEVANNRHPFQMNQESIHAVTL